MSSTAGRRKRSAPKASNASIIAVDQVRAAHAAGVLLISQAQEAAISLKEVATLTEQQRDVGVKWNQRSRPVAVLAAPGMGFGENVLPYLRRSVEGLAVHATSRELCGACRRRHRWPSAEV
jgi:hypothetical protein